MAEHLMYAPDAAGAGAERKGCDSDEDDVDVSSSKEEMLHLLTDGKVGHEMIVVEGGAKDRSLHPRSSKRTTGVEGWVDEMVVRHAAVDESDWDVHYGGGRCVEEVETNAANGLNGEQDDEAVEEDWSNGLSETQPVGARYEDVFPTPHRCWSSDDLNGKIDAAYVAYVKVVCAVVEADVGWGVGGAIGALDENGLNVMDELMEVDGSSAQNASNVTVREAVNHGQAQ